MIIFETNIPQTKTFYAGIRLIFGIGKSRADLICKKLGFSKNLKCQDLSKKQIENVVKVIKSLNFELGNDLKRRKNFFLNKLLSIKSSRGLRLNKGLPVRGQRTHSNASTAKKLRPIKKKTIRQSIAELKEKKKKKKQKLSGKKNKSKKK